MKALHALYKASVNSQLLVRVDGKSIYGGFFIQQTLAWYGMVCECFGVVVKWLMEHNNSHCLTVRVS